VVDAFGAEPFRYFLLREVPFGQDGNFSQAALIGRYNSDLANDLGNLVSRTVSLIAQFSDGTIPAPVPEGSGAEDAEIKQMGLDLFDAVEAAFGAMAFHQALAAIWRYVERANRYIEQTAPWALAKKVSERARLNTVLYTAAEALRMLALYLTPFLPEASRKINQALGLDATYEAQPLALRRGWGEMLVGRKVACGPALFPRIEVKANPPRPHAAEGVSVEQPAPTLDQAPERPMLKPPISIEEFARLDLRVGEIRAAERVPKSKKLLKLSVDMGGEARQVVAGIGAKYAPEVLVGRKIVLLVNLKPAQIMGIESQGMLLAAGGESVLGLATFLEEIPPGTRIK